LQRNSTELSVIGHNGPAHQSWTPTTITADPLGRLERFGPDALRK